MSYLPDVSIIIPCRNEERFIQKCLDSINDNRYPKEKVEILVIDGMSEDGTRKILEEYKKKFPRLIILNNPEKIAASGLNIGIREAKADIIIRADAHAIYEKDYISKCLKYLKEYNADNVGGIIKTMPAKNTIVAKAIATSLSSHFGAASDFRIGATGIKEVDTVFGGCYKREVFDKIGFFKENLIRSQDLELNLRLKRAGGKILLAPDIISYYYPNSSLREFFIHNFKDGIWAIYPLKFVKMPFKIRHYIPLIFILTLPLSIWPYFLLSLFFSTRIAIQEKDFRLFFLMPLAFFCRHFGYGLGSISGLIKILV